MSTLDCTLILYYSFFYSFPLTFPPSCYKCLDELIELGGPIARRFPV